MSRHVTYRGATMDMDSLRRENEKAPAIGNMKVNAKGDQIKGGKVTKTSEEIARENHRIQSSVVRTGLKGPVPKGMVPQIGNGAAPAPKEAVKATKTKETELPSGDIVIEDDTSASE